ncbi:chemotaxis protein [Sporosarcina sp. ANT_H38]|uniref:methyl-accepting chemotaxis protein n=1 Tax=Sporosarcina sp. ANT_H38 TaxID=2597358 RepID=UPI0011F0F010|nr:methyl-accepting chemotaxis protein [Sporosarcina sp. ANT_H38]KAA0964992.1 chemotaxis protein [Sporosarcina sp. ANT_H38]
MSQIVKHIHSTDDILDAFQKVAPYLNKLVQDDITIGIYDTKQLLLNIPGETFALNVKAGDPLEPGDIITNAIKENKDQSSLVPKEIFGFPLIARAIPLQDEHGKVIGGIGIGTSMEKSNSLFIVAESLSAIVEETAASLEEIAGSVTQLADQVSEVMKLMTEVSTGAKEIGKVSTVVRGLSDQSNLLGLNAAIEAARAGDAGKGFNVVAKEIRKLATNSKENVTQIDELTKNISNSILNLTNAFSGINELTTNQAASIEQISATVQEISRNAHSLSTMAESSLIN